jgi:L-alanine-DL-glutamate epimerase-like enolase superfamily enzyme
MGASAARNAARPLLKLKLGGADAVECASAVREAAPGARLIVDANEAWTPAGLERWLPALAGLGIELVEQPLPAGADEALEGLESPVPIGADESCHTAGELAELARRYQVVNVKLDKTGGLTGALALTERAAAHGLAYMVGCMVGTSLGMAPATLLLAGAAFVDLDGPLLMAEDRVPGLAYRDGRVFPPDAALWG